MINNNNDINKVNMKHNIIKAIINREMTGKFSKEKLEKMESLSELLIDSEKLHLTVEILVKAYKCACDREFDNHRLYNLYRQYGDMYAELEEEYNFVLELLEDLENDDSLPSFKMPKSLLPGYEIWQDD
jgi:hypothetical protein